MKKFFVLLAVLAIAAIAATPAFASGTVTWTGSGSQHLPCSGGEHWILSGNATVTGATLMFNGQFVGSFSQSGQGAWSVDTDLGVTADDIGDVTADWTGTGSPQLVLSHCDTATGTTGTTGTGTTTTTGTTGTTGTTSTTGETTGTTGETTGTSSGTTGETTGETTGTTGTSSGATSGTTGSGGVSGATTGGTTGGSTGGTAATPSGGNLPFTGLPVWMPLLAAAAMLGSGIFLVRRRKGEVS
jgi:hypothetical protein